MTIHLSALIFLKCVRVNLPSVDVTPCMCSHRNNSFFSCILLFYGVFDVSSTVIILNVVV